MKVLAANFRIVFSALFLAFLIMLFHIDSFAQKRSEPELKQSALKSFAGDVPGKKNGPLIKAGFDLALLLEEFKEHHLMNTLTPFEPSNNSVHVKDNMVIVDVVAIGDAKLLKPELQKLGMKVTGIAGPVISGLLPIMSIESVAGLSNVRYFSPAMWQTNIGVTSSQGDSAMHTNLVRKNLGVNGTGVTVGVLSDSYNYLNTANADVLSGDLPGTGNPNGYTDNVIVLQDNGNTDEGRAMLQIIHDVAPGAKLAFATAFAGQASFANNIIALDTTTGAKVIVDDVTYFDEPMFQDGIIAQAVDTVFYHGVAYFSSAGNQADRSYQSVWRSSPNISQRGVAFDFDPGPGVDTLQSFTLENGKYVRIELQWDSPFRSACQGCPGSKNDIDIYLINESGTQFLAQSYADNINYGDPTEFFQYTNISGSTQTYNILIYKFAGPDPGLIKYINFGYPQNNLEYTTNSSTIYGHHNAIGAEAVAAACYYYTPAYGINPPLLESYSSLGTTPILFTSSGIPTFDLRSDKPEITAPDGVNTTFFGADWEGDGYPNFFGTSAAAPHAAAVAALMLSADNSLTPAQIYSSLENGALDMGEAGFDIASGYGLIQADNSGPLPVELSSFSASLQEENILLNWTTSTEVMNFGFEVERKSVFSNNKFAAWKKIGFLKGYGSSNSAKEYSFIDKIKNNETAARYSYRLKQIDNNGLFKYSNEIEVAFNSAMNFSLEQNYPNPFNPSTTIRFQIPFETHVRLAVYDILGRVVKILFDEDTKAGLFTVNFNAGSLSSGLYFCKLETPSYSEVRKMLLLK